MKKQTKITQDKTQTRSTIPKTFVDEFEVTKNHKIEWDNKNGKLKGELKKNDTRRTKQQNNKSRINGRRG